jgi:hypothetical protein
MLRGSFGRPIRLPASLAGQHSTTHPAGAQDYDRPVAILYIAATFAPSRSA